MVAFTTKGNTGQKEMDDKSAIARNLASKVETYSLHGSSLLRSGSLKRDMRTILDFFIATEEAGVLFVMMDSKEKILSCNRAMENLTGWSGSDLSGKRLWDISMPLDGGKNQGTSNTDCAAGASMVEIERHSLTTVGSTIECENRIITRNGMKKYVIWRGSRFYDAEMGNECIAMIGFDMTAKKKGESEFYKKIKQITHAHHDATIEGLEKHENPNGLFPYTPSGL